MFSCQKQYLTREILFLPLEHKIHISSQPSNIRYIVKILILVNFFTVKVPDMMSLGEFLVQKTKEN
jgi:hypothetical protein